MGKAQKLIEQLGMGDCTVQQVLNQIGGRVRNQVPKSVWGNTLSELVKLADQGDQEAKTAVKILSQLDRLKGKHQPG